MDWNRVEGSWKFYKGKIKEHWGKLTEDDLYVMNGRREQLAGRIQRARAANGTNRAAESSHT
ncbi:MAG TPA: CsbD family protein [Candidatus Acidoferrales bacterium]|nr:CsbD family protein [Candidatus Acidoferrales bacterium]